MTHHTTTQQEIIDIKCAFQSYNMKKYILIHFEIQKKLIVVGAEGEDEKGKRIDHDFLASIEVLLVDQMEALEMQNWDHVLQLMSYMNQTPKNEAAKTTFVSYCKW